MVNCPTGPDPETVRPFFLLVCRVTPQTKVAPFGKFPLPVGISGLLTIAISTPVKRKVYLQSRETVVEMQNRIADQLFANVTEAGLTLLHDMLAAHHHRKKTEQRPGSLAE